MCCPDLCEELGYAEQPAPGIPSLLAGWDQREGELRLQDFLLPGKAPSVLPGSCQPPPGAVLLLVQPSLAQVQLCTGPALVQDTGEQRRTGKVSQSQREQNRARPRARDKPSPSEGESAPFPGPLPCPLAFLQPVAAKGRQQKRLSPSAQSVQLCQAAPASSLCSGVPRGHQAWHWGWLQGWHRGWLRRLASAKGDAPGF